MSEVNIIGSKLKQTSRDFNSISSLNSLHNIIGASNTKSSTKAAIINFYDNDHNQGKNLVSSRNSLNLIKKTESLNEPFNTFSSTPRKCFKVNQLMNILNDEIRNNCKTEESKESNTNLFTNTNNRNQRNNLFEKKITETTNYNNNSVNKSKKGKVYCAIQNFSIDLQREKRPSVNKPIIRFDNKARLKFDMNFIIESSPTNIKKQDLITLEKLNNEKLKKNLFSEKKVEFDDYLIKTTKAIRTEDSFFDWNRTNKDYNKDYTKRTSNQKIQNKIDSFFNK